MVARHLTRGMQGEQAACEYLEKRGYRVLEKNWRCAKGELDLVCARKRMIVFVEVKTRAESGLVHPRETLTQKKQTRLSAAAKAYLSQSRLWHRSCRFDLVTVVWHNDRNPTVEHIENAFAISDTPGGGHSGWQPW